MSSAPTSAARSTAMRSSDGLQLGVLGGHRLAGPASTAFCSAASSASALLQRRGQVVGLEHPLEDLVFERLDLALREGDLLLDGVIFLVGLHRHRLLAELRQASLVDGDVLLDRAARGLVLGEPLFGGGDALARRLEPRLERLLALRLVGEPALGVVRRGVEASEAR